jgi:hypothetical protein
MQVEAVSKVFWIPIIMNMEWIKYLWRSDFKEERAMLTINSKECQ